ncbi:hypothetical protein PHYBLDRAFT_165963 [Phycomyces blakesleeanus NRRL 1555(-)]|uniref:Uncharacterized protein n=1 Tax=Phycomyces blakesleeanus (strain ATCC 8743b / DSM 1359 / FGSC 10004 / NBRC 33097 / NRRL 1555) TaxID=763407 RepID=A0A167NIF5_PHYB8|nr:hypothetical protein PHYBLDRAFT_175947 [Phycomyces blakesleeanus NRRL 1555(-)]XP_018294030.1 hypothetical protein PHYBLDRAFT_165963 [Phycomyces blakesleeanus NRRL 1555(-)]OAD65558.1 hypothetical protein PHYBLDRAFT_175947 [Phycomyces blakesleeanus NRRL 1555(-)]OAD75990.1 hypothetical protein PHYBLDRAFT_165963 [Phycomyces blakesleeanus NRRL 1555(-)]|eukprot:XP_018283598.1 hypothetical protein PHYBLDRAFT_175947 [Phycomyces blakesleeanus NRRL 1555(-)]
MHNLFLGTPKRLMDHWIKDKDIQDGDFVAMQKTAEMMIVPDALAKDRFENWINFDNVCCLLIKPTITFDEVNTAHQFLQTFCTRCDEPYNAKILTCNMHLHLHLRDTIRDFGPVYSYWLFGFERFNRLLKNLKTNRKIRFEETFMKKFIEDVHKDDLVNSFLQSIRQTSAFPLLTKLTSSFTPATIPSICQRTFRIQSFVEASEDQNVLVKGNEPLPPSAFPLSLKSATTMSDIHYVHLLQYYKVASTRVKVNLEVVALLYKQSSLEVLVSISLHTRVKYSTFSPILSLLHPPLHPLLPCSAPIATQHNFFTILNIFLHLSNGTHPKMINRESTNTLKPAFQHFLLTISNVYCQCIELC